MRHALRELDRILRGETTRPSAIELGMSQSPAMSVFLLTCLLAMTYGFFMGWYSLADRPELEWRQLIASMLKVPFLFVVTLLVTFPSLYVFNTLLGSRLTMPTLIRLLLAALAVMIAVLASFGPITGFFSVSTSSYGFMTLLNVFFFAIAGSLGASFLLQSLHRFDLAHRVAPVPAPAVTHSLDSGPDPSPAGEEVASAGIAELGPLERIEDQMLGIHVRKIFNIWLILFGTVGAQMSWVLRPFIGDPNKPFTWFRPKQSNFFEAVWNTLTMLLS